MKLTKSKLKQIIREERHRLFEEEGWPMPGEGHPLVIAANEKLFAAMQAVETLAAEIEENGYTDEIIQGKVALADVISKLESSRWLVPLLTGEQSK